MNEPIRPPQGDPTTPRPSEPVDGSLRETFDEAGHSKVEMFTGGEWRPFFDTRSWIGKPAVGQVMRLDTEGGWRYEMFNGEKWVFLGEALLQDGRAKLIGDFPDDAALVLAATMHATSVEHGPKPWGAHYTFDKTGLTNFIDHIMDDHRYPQIPDTAELERQSQDDFHAMELALLAFNACAEIECERTGEIGSYVDWDKVRDATEALRAAMQPRIKP